jgi:hypothetical protein
VGRLRAIGTLAFILTSRAICRRVLRWPAIHRGCIAPHGVPVLWTEPVWADHVRQALDLIAVTSSWHLRLVARYCPPILVNQLQSAHGDYQPWSHTCNLWLDRLYDGPVPDTAARIVFASMSARLWDAGIYPWPERRERQRQVCQRVQMEFVRLRRRAAGLEP